MKKRLAALLALALALTLSIPPSAALDLEQARELLEQYYADQIPPEVLELESLEEILAALGDPYTQYLTAEEYQQFLSSVDGEQVTGIGASIENAFSDGYRIMSILPDSPALEAGLEAGDRIIAVDGEALSAGMDVRTVITGEEGTQVTITVIRQADGSRRNYILTRRTVAIPIITYKLEGDAGYIDCTSFGSSTAPTVREALEALDDQASIWIMDLRSNPGGTSEAAAGTAGFFVGGATLVYFRDAVGTYTYLYTSDACPDLTDKPLVILTSPHSASGSELFAAAARDHGFGVAIGQRTFGKGIAQIVFDQRNASGLFGGDALKITAYRFYSPDGTTNHIVGVLPTLLISQENTLAVAQLLSCRPSPYPEYHLKLELAGHEFYVNLFEALEEENRAALTELLESLPPSAVLWFSQGESWKDADPIAPAALAARLGLPYESRCPFPDIAGSPFLREIQTLAAYGLAQGCGDGTFQPEAEITRGEFSAMVAAALNLSAGEDAAPPFPDVDPAARYAGAVSALAGRGLIAGFEDGTFRPEAPIAYQEMVTILSSAAAWINMEGLRLSQTPLLIDEMLDYEAFAPWAQVPARNLDVLGALVGGQAPGDRGTRQVAAGLLCALLEGTHLLWN